MWVGNLSDSYRHGQILKHLACSTKTLTYTTYKYVHLHVTQSIQHYEFSSILTGYISRFCELSVTLLTSTWRSWLRTAPVSSLLRWTASIRPVRPVTPSSIDCKKETCIKNLLLIGRDVSNKQMGSSPLTKKADNSGIKRLSLNGWIQRIHMLMQHSAAFGESQILCK